MNSDEKRQQQEIESVKKEIDSIVNEATEILKTSSIAKSENMQEIIESLAFIDNLITENRKSFLKEAEVFTKKGKISSKNKALTSKAMVYLKKLEKHLNSFREEKKTKKH